LFPTVLGDQITQCTDDRRVRETLVTHRYALTADQLRLSIRQHAEEVGDECLDDGCLANPGVATDDHKAATVINDVVQRSTQPGTLLRPPDDVIGAGGDCRPGRSNHKHYRATWL
jgi:hypothetical protein